MTNRDLSLLTGPDAGPLLAAALGTAGGHLVDWRVRQVDHRPGSGTTASYDATVRWADREQQETLGASVGLGGAQGAPGVIELSDGDRTVDVWRFPQDPGLPALAAAADQARMAELLREFGVPGVTADNVQIRVRAYRPRRRAVLHVASPAGGFFVKVLRPRKAEPLHLRHVVFTEGGLPTPKSLGWTADGLLVLEPLPGTPMRRALWRPESALPDGHAFLDLLGRLPEAINELPHRPAWSDHAGYYASVIGAALPSEASRATQLAVEIEQRLHGQDPVDPTHGDFYEAQLMLTDGRITGLLDVDTAGPGRRADDLGCLIAHIEVLAWMYPEHHRRLSALSSQWSAVMAAQVDERELRTRVAGVVLSLATGPHRVQDAGWEDATRVRLDLVERWLGREAR